MTVWRQWAEQRRGRLIEEAELEYPLATSFGAISPKEMNFWLAKFLVEACRIDGKLYPVNTLYQLCCGLARSLKSDRPTIKLFEDPVFTSFRETLDSRVKELKSFGEGRARQAEVLSEEMEEALWQRGLLGDSHPQQLLDTLVYYVGLYFVLWSGKEHQSFQHSPSQLEFVKSPRAAPYLIYREDVSKTNQGGLKHRKF